MPTSGVVPAAPRPLPRPLPTARSLILFVCVCWHEKYGDCICWPEKLAHSTAHKM